jgi:hypothetical protein
MLITDNTSASAVITPAIRPKAAFKMQPEQQYVPSWVVVQYSSRAQGTLTIASLPPFTFSPHLHLVAWACLRSFLHFDGPLS